MENYKNMEKKNDEGVIYEHDFITRMEISALSDLLN